MLLIITALICDNMSVTYLAVCPLFLTYFHCLLGHWIVIMLIVSKISMFICDSQSKFLETLENFSENFSLYFEILKN